ncbi:MAG TPA: FAD-binding oxidoreductase [Chthoniobacterales bacterium]|nr:FAD-binding oxidoreductase [Chthoniobacterales bacterium]
MNRDISVDVLVIGAGVTRITGAYLLKQSGLSVALIERERAAIRDTGHTTAHVTYVRDTGLDTLQKKFGADHAQAVWDAGAAAIDEIEAIVVREVIDCEFGRVPGYLHAPIDQRTEFRAHRSAESVDRTFRCGSKNGARWRTASADPAPLVRAGDRDK